ncbi:hypothetical protein PAMA_004720 [Pampus argenteus]
MRRVWRKGANKEKVFGCDLLEHLSNSSQEIPQVLRCCCEFVEHYGVVDGIYRLSGVSSNTQKLRGEFENDNVPDLSKDVYLQDVHCVSSLCKTYFRELPNPLLTYQLYDKFAEAVAIQLEEERLVKIRDVLKELPAPHYRTLEFLMCHLVKMASYASETNMHARNLAIVWAPNLLRSKDIEVSGFNGTAAFMEVRVQSIVVEFILTHVPQLFPLQGVSSERRNSLPSPSVIESNQESGPTPLHASYGNISPGDGPLPIRPYHAIIEGTDKRKGSLKGRKWMSIFNIGGRFPDPRRKNKHSTKEKDRPSLRPARSMDSLSFPEGSRRPGQRPPSTSRSPLVTPSTQSSSDVSTSGGGGGGSEYAVTYRRGTGLVSGGSGTQGTYTSLDPDTLGLTCNDAVQSRSPGVSAKASRRAAMHITGPTIVTVPLHITSNLALGVLQGGGSSRVIHCVRDKDGEDQVEDKEGREEKVDRKESGGTERKVEKVRKASVEDKNHKGEETEREGVVYREEDTVAEVAGEEKSDEKEEKKKEEKVGEESTQKANLLTGGRSMSREQRTKSLTSNVDKANEDVSDQDDNDEYMEMKTADQPDLQPEVTHQDNDCVFGASDVLNSTEVDEGDHELSGYVQDNFDFLDQIDCSAMDHMDCSAPPQVNEFSVEPPGHSDDDEYEVMEQAQASQHPAELHHQPPPITHTLCQTRSNSHRPLSLDVDNRHTKSLSLPYMTSPIRVPEDDLGSEEDVEGEYSDDNDYSSEDDEDNMFYQSLPCDYFLNINNLETDTVAQDGSTLLPVDQPKRESELLHPTLSSCEETTTGGEEVKDDEEEEEEEEGEEDEDGQEREEVMKKEEEEDTVNQGGDQPEGNVQSTMEDAQCHEVKRLPSEASTHPCVEFPLPRNEDTDESSATADMQVEKEKEVVDNLHNDRSPCGADSAECEDLEIEQCNSCVTGEMKGGEGGEGDEGEKRQLDEEIEDVCQERERKESRSETAVDTEMLLEVKVSDESVREEPTEGGSEEIADEKHEEKMEGHGREQDNAHCQTNSKIWDEIEDFICEMIEDEESKQGEKKGVREGVEGEGCVVEDVNQIATVEEEVINKTEDKIVEEQKETTKEKHKDAELQQEFEEKEIKLPKKSDLENVTQEEHVVKERAQHHDREEVERKDKDKADEQLTAYNLASVEEKQQLKEVKSDVKESKESWRFEKSQGGVGRKLVITSSPVKVYQVKAVPVVPPKPQHCKITALTLRQQNQERERRDAACMLKVQTEGEHEKDGDTEDEGGEKKELPGLKGGEKETERRMDGDEGATTRNSPVSMCFDVAVAMATMRREKEKECEKEKEKERQRDRGSEVQ